MSATDANEVTIALQAKNPFGAYLPIDATCVLRAGKVDIEATMAKRKGLVAKAAYQREMQVMDEGIKCLNDKIARRAAGKTVSPQPCPGE